MFDRNKIKLKAIGQRKNDLDLLAIKSIDSAVKGPIDLKLEETARCIVNAKKNKAAIVLMFGGHLIRSGVQNYLIDLMERGYLSCLATNGAGMIHDYEFSLIGATTESVAKYISEGQFGLWKESGAINDIINNAYKNSMTVGMGEAVGKAINEGDFPNKNISILAAGYRLGIPVTIHVGIGCDIIHEHANCNGAATGALSYNDFLRYAEVVSGLENGVMMNFGSAVMAPEVFLKALSMVRNVAKQNNKEINRFTTLVCDLYDLPADYNKEPAKDDKSYYFRPWKTMLVRTTADGGKGIYVKGRHEQTIPLLWQAINQVEKNNG